eukprot:scaffold8646_cov115-Isochrysis_galbana.AAC.2
MRAGIGWSGWAPAARPTPPAAHAGAPAAPAAARAQRRALPSAGAAAAAAAPALAQRHGACAAGAAGSAASGQACGRLAPRPQPELRGRATTGPGRAGTRSPPPRRPPSAVHPAVRRPAHPRHRLQLALNASRPPEAERTMSSGRPVPAAAAGGRARVWPLARCPPPPPPRRMLPRAAPRPPGAGRACAVDPVERRQEERGQLRLLERLRRPVALVDCVQVQQRADMRGGQLGQREELRVHLCLGLGQRRQRPPLRPLLLALALALRLPLAVGRLALLIIGRVAAVPTQRRRQLQRRRPRRSHLPHQDILECDSRGPHADGCRVDVRGGHKLSAWRDAERGGGVFKRVPADQRS